MRPMRKALPAAAIVVVLSALAGGMFGSKVAARQDRANERYRMYLAALDAIQNDYVESLDQQQLVYGSIDGMLRTLDPHSVFLSPEAYREMNLSTSGHFGGLGIVLYLILWVALPKGSAHGPATVSYTHLTLPTIYSV